MLIITIKIINIFISPKHFLMSNDIFKDYIKRSLARDMFSLGSLVSIYVIHSCFQILLNQCWSSCFRNDFWDYFCCLLLSPVSQWEVSKPWEQMLWH